MHDCTRLAAYPLTPTDYLTNSMSIPVDSAYTGQERATSPRSLRAIAQLGYTPRDLLRVQPCLSEAGKSRLRISEDELQGVAHRAELLRQGV